MSETIALGDKDVAYLVGKAGETRMRLEKFSGAQLSIDSDVVKISGTDEAREVRAACNSSARNYSIFGKSFGAQLTAATSPRSARGSRLR